MKRSLFSLVLAGVVAVLATAALPVLAQDYPSRPVKLIAPYPPGGGTDAVARMIGEKLAALLGQPVVIENRAGAGGSLGTEMAARAVPDGYTLVLGSTATHAVNPSLYSKAGYDPIADFVAVATVATTPALLVAHPSVKADNIAELIRLIKAQAAVKPLTYASAGSGSIQHMAGELFKTMTKAEIQHIPYRGAGPAMADLLAGHVAMAFDTMPSAMPQVRSGKLKALGISSATRHRSLPDVPAIAETVPGYQMVTWYGIFAPKGTPAPVVELLNQRLKQALDSPDLREKFATAGLDTSWSSPAEFAERLKREVPRMRTLIEQAGAKVD